MYKNKKRLSLLLLIFFITIITGAVYAAVNGQLKLISTVSYLQNVELRFTEGTPNVVSESGNGYGSYTIDPTGQTISFMVVLAEPGDKVTFYYNVENTGFTNAEINKYSNSMTPDSYNPLRIYGEHEPVPGGRLFDTSKRVILAPGAVVEDCEITFEWEAGVNDSVEGAYSYVITLGYSYTRLPATVTP